MVASCSSPASMSFPIDASVLIEFVHSVDISAALFVRPLPRAISFRWLAAGNCVQGDCGGGSSEVATAAAVVDLDLGFEVL